MKILRLGLGIFLISVIGLTASAQSPNDPVDSPIERDVPVFDTLTDVAFFDLWRFYGAEGEQYQLTMDGADGLAPLIGVRGASGDVFAASNQLSDGTTLEAEPDTQAAVTFVAPETGELVVIATRANGQDGATVGAYRLILTLLAPQPDSLDPYLDVSFRCKSELAESMAYIEFGDAGESGDVLRLTVWASFRPVIRVGDGATSEASCVLPDDEGGLRGTITGENIPLGALSFATPDPQPLDHTVMFEIPVDVANGSLGLMIGSLDGAVGVFVAQLDGLSLEIAEDYDIITLRHGPLAKDGTLRLITQRQPESRLDLQVSIDPANEGVTVCDDWGLRSCELGDWHSADIAYNKDVLRFDVLDAAVEMATGDADPIFLTIFGGNPNSLGRYTLWLIGGVTSNLP